VAPFVSVIVPAARRRSALKSRLFRGIEQTALLDNCSPPGREETIDSSLPSEIFRSTEEAAEGRSTSWGYSALRPFHSTESENRPGSKPSKWKLPPGPVSAVLVLPAEPLSCTDAPTMALPAWVVTVPCHPKLLPSCASVTKGIKNKNRTAQTWHLIIDL
jgi:hypothetical protein